MRPRYDVIVVGGGPAGSMTAYFLAKAGIRTAVMDSSRFPREKPCGGGLQARALSSIPLELAPVVRSKMHRMALSFGLSDPYTRAYPEPLVYGIRRLEFDHYLIRCAAEAGADIHERTRVHSVNVNDGALVATSQGEFACRCVVGADGANSIVSRTLNRRDHYFWQAAVYCEIPEELIEPGACAHDCMRVDWGTLPSGYAWMFPKNGSVNIGAGGPFGIARLLKQYIGRFIRSTRLLKNKTAGELSLTGHQLPTLTRRTRVAGKKVLLVGDAAGLVEPFTGDGISFACRSARIAADCIRDNLNRPSFDLSDYQAQLTDEVGSELWWARKVLSISVAFPSLIYRLFRHNDKVWRTFCRTLRGEESFHRLKKDILGPLEFAWSAVDLFTQIRERTLLRAPHRIFLPPEPPALELTS
jgi:geranylgeranyl reductase family protein